MIERTIAILMATYNGEKFLAEQIDSIMNQSCKDWHLYVHDDGSTDETVAVVKNYIQRFPNQITLLDYPSQGGACKNFLSMLGKVESPYYMFCDQDDVWLPEKISLTFEEMKQQEAKNPGKPIVIHTDLQVVDEHLSATYESMWNFSGICPQYVKTFTDAGGHTTIATGSTMLFNREAKVVCCLHLPDKAIMHDSWLCLCVLYHDGILKAINSCTVLYRQHGSNCLGSGHTPASNVDLFYRAKHFTKIFNSNRKYYAMLSSLGYGSVWKYIISKLKYKIRLSQGHY